MIAQMHDVQKSDRMFGIFNYFFTKNVTLKHKLWSRECSMTAIALALHAGEILKCGFLFYQHLLIRKL